VGVMPVGVYGNHRTPGGIARNALLGDRWNRDHSDAECQRSEAHREFETHGFAFYLVLFFVGSRNIYGSCRGSSNPMCIWFRFTDAAATRAGGDADLATSAAGFCHSERYCKTWLRCGPTLGVSTPALSVFRSGRIGNYRTQMRGPKARHSASFKRSFPERYQTADRFFNALWPSRLASSHELNCS
jgi:hypothetical protein